MKVQGLGVMGLGLGSGIGSLGLGVWVSECGVLGVWFRVWVEDSGLRA